MCEVERYGRKVDLFPRGENVFHEDRSHILTVMGHKKLMVRVDLIAEKTEQVTADIPDSGRR